MASFAEGTTVSPERSRAEIETVLNRYGATGFAYATEACRARIEFRAMNRRVRFDLTLPDPADDRFKYDRYYRLRSDGRQRELYDAEVRRLWRALVLGIKAKLEIVKSGLTIFEHEFLAHIVVLETGQTVGDVVAPQIAEQYDNPDSRRPILLLGSGS